MKKSQETHPSLNGQVNSPEDSEDPTHEFMDLHSIGYPRTLINHHGICGNGGNAEIVHAYEMDRGMDYGQRERYRIDSVCAPVLPSGRYTLVNGGFLKDYPDDYLESYMPFVPAGLDSLLLDRPHFQSHPAYTFEYCTRHGRDFFLKHQFRIRFYSSEDLADRP